jgi:3-dehydroquinate dehydratase II
MDAEYRNRLIAYADDLGLTCVVLQCNSESELVECVSAAGNRSCGLIIGVDEITCTSAALVDALRALRQPVIRVQLQNVQRRESANCATSVSETATGVICGLGYTGYELAIDGIASLLRVP